MEEQTENSVNLEVPSRWKRFSAYLLDLLINFIVIWIIPYGILTSDADNIVYIIIIITIIVLIFVYLIFIIRKKTTLWNKSVWIIALNNKNNSINWRQALLRYFIFNPAFLALILILIWFIISLMLYLINGWCMMHTISSTNIQNPECEKIYFIRNTGNRLGFFGLIFLLISILEIFFKCPTFIDKWLWIKRIYKKSK